MLPSGLLAALTMWSVYQSAAAQALCATNDASVNCVACMEAHPDCLWCYDQGGTGCGTKDTLSDCENMVSVSNSQINVTNLPTFGGDPDNKLPARQISPQEVTLNLRPGTSETVTINVTLAKDYPVDLYYLMDLSESMGDDKENVASLGQSLAEGLRAITKDVQLGFGSFVDKVTMPFVNMASLDNPCNGGDQACAPPYGFRNGLSLTPNISAFVHIVNATPVSGNLDGPEGGFDAMMQALVCEEVIKWRQKSRKMLVFSTDADFHSAGDGKLGGIVQPNDGKCHMDNNEYTYSTTQDYPSISHLSQNVKKGQVNVIFAVTESELPRYTNLADFFEGSVVGQLSDNSDNVVDLVKDNYRKISEEVTMSTDGPVSPESLRDGAFLTYSLMSNCAVAGGELKQTDQCAGVKPGDSVSFRLKVTAGMCIPGEGDQTRSFTIGPQSLDDRLKVNVNVQCSCACDDQETSSSLCSTKGLYECGRCACEPQNFGDKCQCSTSNLTADSTSFTDQCEFRNKICSGFDFGDCVCGVCACKCVKGEDVTPDCKRYSGEFCQCNIPGGCEKKCSGKGQCLCDEATGTHRCECQAGLKGSYTGNSCDCAPPDTCYPSAGEDKDKLCSGRSSSCVCGECRDCEPGPGGDLYGGPACDICTNCSSRCPELRDCAECRVFGGGKLSEELCELTCGNYSYTSVDTLPAVAWDQGECRGFKTAEGCEFDFVYDIGKGTVVARRFCVEPFPIWIIILAVVGGIVIVGLIILAIWKVVTTIHDGREYAKWEEDRKQAQWEQVENPIFEHATTRFQNPTYAGKK